MERISHLQLSLIIASAIPQVPCCRWSVKVVLDPHHCACSESCDRPLLADFGVGKRLGQEEEEDEEERNTAPWNDAIRTHSRHIGGCLQPHCVRPLNTFTTHRWVPRVSLCQAFAC